MTGFQSIKQLMNPRVSDGCYCQTMYNPVIQRSYVSWHMLVFTRRTIARLILTLHLLLLIQSIHFFPNVLLSFSFYPTTLTKSDERHNLWIFISRIFQSLIGNYFNTRREMKGKTIEQMNRWDYPPGKNAFILLSDSGLL